VPKFLLPERTTSTSAITVPGTSQSASNAQRTLSAVSYGRDIKIKPPDSEHTHTLAALSGAKSSVKVANGDVKERYRARDLTKGSHSAELIDSMVDNGLGTYISHGVDDLKIAGAHYQAVKAALIRALALSPLTMLIFPVFLFVTLGQHTGTVRSPLGAAPSRGLWLPCLARQLLSLPSCPTETGAEPALPRGNTYLRPNHWTEGLFRQQRDTTAQSNRPMGWLRNCGTPIERSNERMGVQVGRLCSAVSCGLFPVLVVGAIVLSIRIGPDIRQVGILGIVFAVLTEVPDQVIARRVRRRDLRSPTRLLRRSSS
jgi:hypothetical protein